MELAERARLAFIQGWIESGGPMTDRVRSAYRAAMELVGDNPDKAGLVEVTLQIGKLEGTWAKIFADRESVHDDYGPEVTHAVRALMKAALDIPAAVRDFRQRLTQGADSTAIKVAANVVALRLVHAAADTARPEYRAALLSLADAITASGHAGTDAGHQIAQMAEGAPPPPPPDPRSDSDQKALAAAALGRIVRGTTTDVSRRLAKLATQVDDPSNLDEDDLELMQDEIEDITSGDSERSSKVLGDLAIAQGFLSGLLAAYAARGERQVKWVTAGDKRVCPTCDAYEAGSPYTLLEVPGVPHGNCRCVLQPF